MATKTEKALYSVEDFKAMTGLGHSKTFELIGSGQIESILVGRRRLIPAEALQSWIERLREQARSAAA